MRPTSTFSASMISVRNPDASALTVYVPAGMRGDVVVPFEIGADGHGEIDRVVAHADHGGWDHRARFVDDASLENRRGLRLHGRRGAQHHEHDHRRRLSRDLPHGQTSRYLALGTTWQDPCERVCGRINARDQRNTHRISSIATMDVRVSIVPSRSLGPRAAFEM